MVTDSPRGSQGELPLSRLAGVQPAAETVSRIWQAAYSSLPPREVAQRTAAHLVGATALTKRDERDGSLTGFAVEHSRTDLTSIDIARFNTLAELRTAVSMTIHALQNGVPLRRSARGGVATATAAMQAVRERERAPLPTDPA